MMESIAALSMDMSAMRTANSYSIAITKKMMDSEELAAQELMKMLEAVPVPSKGDFIDVTV